MGEREKSALGRNFLLTSALEIEGLDTKPTQSQKAASIKNATSMKTLLESMKTKMNPDRCVGKTMTAMLNFTDSGERIVLTVIFLEF